MFAVLSALSIDQWIPSIAVRRRQQTPLRASTATTDRPMDDLVADTSALDAVRALLGTGADASASSSDEQLNLPAPRLQR